MDNRERVNVVSAGAVDQDEMMRRRRKLGSASLMKMRMSMSRSFSLRSPSLNKLRLMRVFDMFDKNSDGIITAQEMSQALILLGLDAQPFELLSIINSFIKPSYVGLAFDDFQALHESLNHTFTFQHMDRDDEELVAPPAPAPTDADIYSEPLQQQQQQQMDSDLKEAFKVFDEDGDGFISATELQAVLSKLDLPEANQELSHIQLMISSFDHNHDGVVDFFEFKHMMSSYICI